MISICIPVYNFNITSLINELMREARTLLVPYEIICIDDASEKNYQIANKEAANEAVYIQLEKNIGRAKIRNLFLRYARYENLLFLDCDSLLVTDHFLHNYIQYIQQYNDYTVVCGGRIYKTEPPERKYKLRWLYGIKRESLAVAERNKNSNTSFMTNNFLISKNTFLQVQFDERITTYGHEDTLFGYALEKKKIVIHHIDNPVLNGHLETNKEYLIKTEQSVVNLTHILTYINYEQAFIKNVSLLRFYYKNASFKPFITISFFLLKPFIYSLLSNGFINLPLFDFYKLGILAKISKEKINLK